MGKSQNECNTHFEIYPFALLSTKYQCFPHKETSKLSKSIDWCLSMRGRHWHLMG